MPESEDRRAAERFAVNADTSCPFLAPLVEDFGSAQVRDVSLQGVGLVVGRRVEPGTSLAAVLANRACGFSKAVLLRVVHVTALEGGFLVGGTITPPLNGREMPTLVLEGETSGGVEVHR
jgi:hypothetical protein